MIIDLPKNHTGYAVQASVVSKIIDGFKTIYLNDVHNTLVSELSKQVKENLPKSIDKILGFKNQT